MSYLVLTITGHAKFFEDLKEAKAFGLRKPQKVYEKVEFSTPIGENDSDIFYDREERKLFELNYSPKEDAICFTSNDTAGVIDPKDLEYFFGNCEHWKVTDV